MVQCLRCGQKLILRGLRMPSQLGNMGGDYIFRCAGCGERFVAASTAGERLQPLDCNG